MRVIRKHLGEIGLLLALVGTTAWAAQTPEFVTGGIGDEESSALQAVKPQYNLHLLLTEKSGAYLSGVQVTIADRHGSTVLDTQAKGPYLWVKLPQGTYRVSATLDGATLDRTVNIKGQRTSTVHLTW
ncbi:hypothetical protein N8I74_12630 [Chitiniphilus purpureus]|uniref:Carboxypeptidase regulatory-like domain-containing protein n=1 Tax=Chitiniphilus purpureus TaxID=2981137 RepID=A0ABY6DIU6_9NEIS|nr:hypothetical protein [Chitiniphilus sp. CD1]UXY14163.1 hypothetical protein N8I74_12630 [Chitiniphilus sp. CD1]